MWVYILDKWSVIICNIFYSFEDLFEPLGDRGWGGGIVYTLLLCVDYKNELILAHWVVWDFSLIYVFSLVEQFYYRHQCLGCMFEAEVLSYVVISSEEVN